MKNILVILFMIIAFTANSQTVIRGTTSRVVGGESTDTTTLVTTWTENFAFSTPGEYLLEGRFQADTVSGTANYTISIDHSWDYVNWDTLQTVSQTADRDTFMNFSVTTTRPYARFKNVTTSGTQVVENKSFSTFVKQ